MADTILPHIQALADGVRLLNARGIPQISGHINVNGVSIYIDSRHAESLHHEWTVTNRVTSDYADVHRVMGGVTITTTLFGARWAKAAILAGKGGTVDLRDVLGGEE